MADFSKDTETTVLINETDSCRTHSSVLPVLDDESRIEEFNISDIPNFYWIEMALFTNVFLSGFDGTVTASIYTTIGNEFKAANLASWITTSYLITSTAFQPLYGSISDVIGRRKCVFFASISFLLGCLGCSVAQDMFTLNLMRSVTGIGGGGLITMSTIINSDIVPTRKRGLIQAFQNILLGMGSVFGASFGGAIASYIGWRYNFIIQIFPSIWTIYIGYRYIQNQPGFKDYELELNREILSKIDIHGAIVLVLGLTVQLLVLTLGGNEIPWSDHRLILLGIFGILLLVYFFYIEVTTKANPIIPVKRFKSLFTLLLMGQNFMLGLSAYAYLFALPLLFQLVLGDSTTKAGLRLAIPSFSTPIGGVITGVLMNKYGLLKSLVYAGTFTMTVGNFLILSVNYHTPSWLLSILLTPANIGQGLAYPSSLFTFVFAYGPTHQATSTSTTYLMRSIGGVWGVSSVSAIIQAYLKYKVADDLKKNGSYDKHEISKIIRKISKSTENIQNLPDVIREIVLKDYATAIRLAQLFSCICCFCAFLFCLLRDITRSKPNLT